MSEEVTKKETAVAEKTSTNKKVGAEKEVKSLKKEDSVASEKSQVKPKIKRRKNVRRQVQRGKAFITSTYNNTKICFSDLHGNVLAWSSSGLIGFKGAKKATTYAANQVLNNAHEKVQRYGLKDIEVFVKGVGSGRDAALRALVQKGYNLISIKDTTPIPHNGCRPKKPRRV
ncbi:MAG TPA: 30S ribosomal protein S11 [Candidatus Moranbacteria bacterium]|nr:30S ribosomal protein S11 [Candidatus Moranbacteria bacterium]